MIRDQQTLSTPLFDPRIESLRGLAALAVVITHSCAVLRVDGSPAFWHIRFADQSFAQQTLSLLSALFNSSAAVVLFFVLSGYVLTLSLNRQKAGGISVGAISSYAIRRLFRLLPPMWASIAVMWIVLSAFRRPADNDVFSLWFTSVFATTLGPVDIFQNLALVSFRTNPVTWTMYIEFIGSAFIPLSLVFCAYSGTRRSLWILVALAILTFVAYPKTPTGPPSQTSLTFIYLVCFQTGLALTTFREKSISPLLLCVVAIAIFVLERLVSPPNYLGTLMLTFASAALLTGVTKGQFERFLTSTPLRFLGKISYSLYLLHSPVLYVTGLIAVSIGIAGPGIAPTLFVFLVAIPLSILFAWIGYETIESWSIAAGRIASNQWIARRARAI